MGGCWALKEGLVVVGGEEEGWKGGGGMSAVQIS